MPLNIINDAVNVVTDAVFGKKEPIKHNGKPIKNIVHSLTTTKFQCGWQWIVEFEDTHGIKPPADFDIYCKSIEHGGLTLEYEEKQIGANTINSPVHKTAGEVTITLRDHEDARCETFFKKLAMLVVNLDGTVNLPKDYLFTMQLYRFTDKDEKIPYKRWRVSIGEYGGFTRGRDETGQFVSFNAVFKKYQALDKE